MLAHGVKQGDPVALCADESRLFLTTNVPLGNPGTDPLIAHMSAAPAMRNVRPVPRVTVQKRKTAPTHVHAHPPAHGHTGVRHTHKRLNHGGHFSPLRSSPADVAAANVLLALSSDTSSQDTWSSDSSSIAEAGEEEASYEDAPFAVAAELPRPVGFSTWDATHHYAPTTSAWDGAPQPSYHEPVGVFKPVAKPAAAPLWFAPTTPPSPALNWALQAFAPPPLYHAMPVVVDPAKRDLQAKKRMLAMKLAPYLAKGADAGDPRAVAAEQLVMELMRRLL